MPESECLTILFADISGSTRLYDSLGNAAAKSIIDEALAALARAAARGGGEVVKSIGDEILCTFPNPDLAAGAAPDMHRSLSATSPERPLSAYIGIHCGEVIREDGDVFGDAVNVAARVVKLHRPGQTLTTGSTLARLAPEFRGRARLIDRLSLKGKQDPFEIYELVWDAEVVTFLEDALSEGPEHVGVQLELSVGGKRLVMGAGRSELTLGRLPHNDLVVASTCTSRTHARIERRGDRFRIVDLSSNGTWIESRSSGRRHLRREEAFLVGEGCIILGAEPCEDKVEPVHYRILIDLAEGGGEDR